MEEKHQRKKQGIPSRNQGSGVNQKEIGTPKVTNIYYNTVENYYNLTSAADVDDVSLINYVCELKPCSLQDYLRDNKH